MIFKDKIRFTQKFVRNINKNIKINMEYSKDRIRMEIRKYIQDDHLGQMYSMKSCWKN